MPQEHLDECYRKHEFECGAFGIQGHALRDLYPVGIAADGYLITWMCCCVVPCYKGATFLSLRKQAIFGDRLVSQQPFFANTGACLLMSIFRVLDRTLNSSYWNVERGENRDRS
ncbi:hypothetical protein TNCV_545611 [Trichonephila clavipes]|nr:hypothetical protein TNCV_545611 [Trichonephila clavipes]